MLFRNQNDFFFKEFVFIKVDLGGAETQRNMDFVGKIWEDKREYNFQKY